MLSDPLYWLAQAIGITVRTQGIKGPLEVLVDGLLVAVEVEAAVQGRDALLAQWDAVVPGVATDLRAVDGYVSDRFQAAEGVRQRKRALEEWGPAPEARQRCVTTILHQGLVEIRRAARSGNTVLVIELADLLHDLPAASETDAALRLWSEQDLRGAITVADDEALPLLVGWQQLCSAAMEEPPF